LCEFDLESYVNYPYIHARIQFIINKWIGNAIGIVFRSIFKNLLIDIIFFKAIQLIGSRPMKESFIDHFLKILY